MATHHKVVKVLFKETIKSADRRWKFVRDNSMTPGTMCNMVVPRRESVCRHYLSDVIDYPSSVNMVDTFKAPSEINVNR